VLSRKKGEESLYLSTGLRGIFVSSPTSATYRVSKADGGSPTVLMPLRFFLSARVKILFPIILVRGK